MTLVDLFQNISFKNKNISIPGTEEREKDTWAGPKSHTYSLEIGDGNIISIISTLGNRNGSCIRSLYLASRTKFLCFWSHNH